MSSLSSSLPRSKSTVNQVAPEALMRVKHLELRAKMVVEGFMAGLHRSPYHGFSVEFTDYRQYSPGDDLRYLDWKLLARRDRHYIKRFEDETNLRCHLLLDVSRSMAFGSQNYSKLEYARTLAATLAWFFNRQRDAVGLMTFDDQVLDVVPPRYRSGHLRRIMVSLERVTSGRETNVETPLEQIAQSVTKRAMVILISDLLTPIETLERKLAYLRARGHDVVIMRVLDRAELEFSFQQASQFTDLETGRRIYVDPESVRSDYLERFESHANALQQLCQRAGIDLFSLVSDQPMETALLSIVHSRVGAASGARGRSRANPAGRMQ